MKQILNNFPNVFPQNTRTRETSPFSLVVTENHYPLIIAVGESWTCSGTPFQVVGNVLNCKREGKYKLQYVEYLPLQNPSVKLKTFTKEEVSRLLLHYGGGMSHEITQTFLTNLTK